MSENTFTFGDNRALCDRLLALVKDSTKTATCGALRDFIAGGEALPEVGRKDIALDWDGKPAVEIETLSVIQQRFCDVDESFALLEGENESLAGWQRDHTAFFQRNGGFDPEMMLVCEVFRVTKVF